MRLLANENFPRIAVSALRSHGHDVAWVREDAPGSSDRDVLRRATAESRILITFDKDFGELAFRFGLPANCGVVLFRIPMISPDYVVRQTTEILESRVDWGGFFSVAEPGFLRMRPLPPA